ncbi:undecaprenyldiphospho-muramoylpentapeptide beta-N-acetylglucosaminyltransferase [Methylohalomonas lacus]|nr:undecaprenyldiphospho-muramoylpentapeptide beta-N-acetylglucosaminyltransferase [Methylohalomonas lacus]
MVAKVRILIMAGGTGGHVFPGLAVAETLREQGHEVVWLGTHRGLENRLVPAAGLQLERISISGLRGKGMLSLLAAPVRLLRALWQSLLLLRRLKPNVVLGMGGFVSGPGGLAAWLLRRPLCLHEQNAVAGLTNRLLSRFAVRVMEAFPGAMPATAQASAVGNPVRRTLHELPAPETRLTGRDGPLRLLVIGGSQGARKLNQAVPAALGQIGAAPAIEVWHQTGEADRDLVRRNYATLSVQARVDAFVEDMAAAYAWADLVICRAGALTLTELTAVGLGSILVPFPHAVDDHQTVNARWLSDNDAAILLPEPELAAGTLAARLRELAGDRQHLQGMAVNARALARPDAAAEVAAICLEAAA